MCLGYAFVLRHHATVWLTSPKEEEEEAKQDNQLSKYPFLVPTCRIRGQTDTYTGFAEAQAFLIIKSSLNE